MEKRSSLKSALVFFVFLLSIAVNLEDNVIARLGFDANYLMMALVAVVFTGLLAHQSVLLIVLVLFLSIGANMPADFMLNFGIDRDYFTGVLVAIVIVPLIARVFNL
jgi:hypothetical protein|tara:strand:- start:8159 stop:8479 length:321 start_codon:yes stop_codon:yes gene_type:complete